MKGLTFNIAVAVVLELAAEVTERALLRPLLRLAAYVTEYAMIGLAVKTTGCDALKLVIDALQ